MKPKTIKKVLKAKVTDWLKTIDDSNVRRAIEKDTIITGGAIASMLLREEVKDFDVYFKTKETVKLVAEYYVNQFNKLNPGNKNMLECDAPAFVLDGADLVGLDLSNRDDIEKVAPGFGNQNPVSRMIVNTPEDRIKIIIRSDGVAGETGSKVNELIGKGKPFEDIYDVLERADNLPATALDSQELPEVALDSETDKVIEERYRPIFMSTNAITLSNKIQIIVRFYGDVGEIHKNYDFEHCTNAWESFGNTLTLRNEALTSLMSKELIYTGSKYPLCSIIRTRKFIARQWTINAGQYLKMCMQLSDLDLHNIDVLEDQLVGVDSAYFMSLIKALEKSGNMDTEYVCSIVDKIF